MALRSRSSRGGFQYDSTINYVLDRPAIRTKSADRAKAGPYNTYDNTGLPPTPISAPGEDAIKAAVNPDAGNWLFFVKCEKNGTSCFAVTNEEHDFLLQVPDAVDESAYVPALVVAGYTLRIREPEWLEYRLLRRRGEPHDVNVHVFSPRYAADEITGMLAFRDWLRTDEVDRIRYATAERELSTRDRRYVQDYAEAKSEVVQQILSRALR